MDHITYPTSAADRADRLHLSPLLGAGALVPDRDQESPQLGPIIIPFRRVALLLVDGDGNERQERVWIPAKPWEDILRDILAQHGLEVIAIDEIPEEIREIEIDPAIFYRKDI